MIEAHERDCGENVSHCRWGLEPNLNIEFQAFEVGIHQGSTKISSSVTGRLITIAITRISTPVGLIFRGNRLETAARP